MLGAAGDGSRALAADLLGQALVGASGVDAQRLGAGNGQLSEHGQGQNSLGNARKSDVTVERVRGDQLGLARVPILEHLCGRGAAENAWVDEAGKFDVGNVAAGAVDAFKVPDCFGAGDVLAR